MLFRLTKSYLTVYLHLTLLILITLKVEFFMVTINDIVDEMTSKGYKITNRTIKYYLERNLLPQPEKQGGYREGVKLVFPDKEEVLARLYRIFELKGRGYTLSEIKKTIERERAKELAGKRSEYLQGFIERDGRFYNKSSSTNLLIPQDNLERILLSGEVPSFSRETEKLNKLEPIASYHFEQIEKSGAVLPIFLIGDKPAYDEFDIPPIVYWLLLRLEYDIEWDIIEALVNKHAENFDRYVFLPEPDGIRFSREFIGWHRQFKLNLLGGLFFEYLELIEDGFMSVGGFADSELTCFWGAEYETLGAMIDDFLRGKCAFVPNLFTSNQQEFFLKRF